MADGDKPSAFFCCWSANFALTIKYYIAIPRFHRLCATGMFFEV